MVQVAILLGAFLSLALGMLVFLNNPKAKLFKTYFGLSISSALWLLVNGLTSEGIIKLQGSFLLFLSRLITPLSLLVSLALLLFFIEFNQRRVSRLYISALIPCVVVSLFSFSGANVRLVAGQPTLGQLFPFFMGAVIYTNLLTLYLLFSPIKRDIGSSQKKLQLTYLKLGAVMAIAPAIVLGVILPLFTNSAISDLGPLASLIFLIFVSIAILRNHLFDVRFAIARTIAYLLSLGFIALGYGGLLFGLSSLNFFSRQNVTLQRTEYIGFTLVTALLFPLLRKTFAKLTDRFLYQDAYDTQEFLARLNKAIVGNIDLQQILRSCSQIIRSELKLEFCAFSIRGAGKTRIFSDGVVPDEVSSLLETESIKSHEGEVLATDYLSPALEKLKREMYKKRVAVVAPLISLQVSNGHVPKIVGYLILGQKRSGNIYSTHDLKIVQIIANELVIAIQNALRFEEIERFNVTLQEEIDNATRKLRRSNQKLQDLDETKDDFISMASHQLRTPLTAVKGYVSMVLDGDAGKLNQTQAEMLEQAFSSSQRMVSLITDLLNISRLKTGKFVIEPVPTNLGTVVEGEVAQLSETAKAKRIALTYKKPASFPTLMLDEVKTRQVIMNFIDNAIYYTPPGGHIRVELIDKPSTIELLVVDDGIGVPRSEQHHLFSKFYRATNARKARPDGTGLGLFMAKKVIVAQGGSLIFSSEEGHGSTFGFTFIKDRLKVTDGTADSFESLSKKNGSLTSSAKRTAAREGR